jgi:hypothetical protein
VILLYDSGFAEIIAYLTEKFSNFYERISFLSPVEDYYLSDMGRVYGQKLEVSVPIPRRGLLSFRLVIRRRQIGLK